MVHGKTVVYGIDWTHWWRFLIGIAVYEHHIDYGLKPQSIFSNSDIDDDSY